MQTEQVYDALAREQEMREQVESAPRNVTLLKFYRPDGDDFKVKVRVLDTRNSYGTYHFLIEPCDGQGQRWTTGARLSEVGA